MQKKIGVAGVIGFEGTLGRHPSAALQATILPSLSHPIIPIYYYFVAYFMIATAIQFFSSPFFQAPGIFQWIFSDVLAKKVPATIIAIATKNAPNLSIGRLSVFYSKVIYALKPA